jgi:hypothetical protein
MSSLLAFHKLAIKASTPFSPLPWISWIAQIEPACSARGLDSGRFSAKMGCYRRVVFPFCLLLADHAEAMATWHTGVRFTIGENCSPRTFGRLAQLVRALARQARGHWFEPSIAHCKRVVDRRCQRPFFLVRARLYVDRRIGVLFASLARRFARICHILPILDCSWCNHWCNRSFGCCLRIGFFEAGGGRFF